MLESHQYTMVAVKKEDLETLLDYALVHNVSLVVANESNSWSMQNLANEIYEEYNASYESSYDESSC